MNPAHCRGYVQIDKHILPLDKSILLRPKVRTDSVIGSNLGERPRAAGPKPAGVDLPALEVAVGIVERSSIRLGGQCPQDRVVHDPLHAISVTGLSRDSQQIPRQLEVGISAAGSFKAVMALCEAREQVVTAGRLQRLVGAPASGRVTLLGQQIKAVACCLKVFPAAQGEVCLRC